MKKLILIFSIVASAQNLIAQRINIDSLLQQISREKDADKKVMLITRAYSPEINNDPQFVIQTGLKFLNEGWSYL
jgi:hypothetical protein